MSRGLFKIYLGIVFPDETMGFKKVLNIKVYQQDDCVITTRFFKRVLENGFSLKWKFKMRFLNFIEKKVEKQNYQLDDAKNFRSIPNYNC